MVDNALLAVFKALYPKPVWNSSAKKLIPCSIDAENGLIFLEPQYCSHFAMKGLYCSLVLFLQDCNISLEAGSERPLLSSDSQISGITVVSVLGEVDVSGLAGWEETVSFFPLGEPRVLG